jgi:hypothetical protein
MTKKKEGAAPQRPKRPDNRGLYAWLVPEGRLDDPDLILDLGAIAHLVGHRAASDAALRAALRATVARMEATHAVPALWRVICCAILAGSDRPLTFREVLGAARAVRPTADAERKVYNALAALGRRSEVGKVDAGYVLLVGPGARHA